MIQDSTSGAGVAVRERLPRHLAAATSPSLEVLAATANREHGLCETGLKSALQHALAAGAALNKARSVVQDGEWRRWLGANFVGGSATANHYMRLSTHRERLTDDMSIRQARAVLVGAPDVRPRGVAPIDPSLATAAVALVRDEGLSRAKAAQRLGIHADTVRKYLDPEAYRRKASTKNKTRRRAAAALAATERERAISKAVRKAGAALSEAYSMSARMGGVLAQAEAEATSESREALAEARRHYHRMSDEIIRALGVSS